MDRMAVFVLSLSLSLLAHAAHWIAIDDKRLARCQVPFAIGSTMPALVVALNTNTHTCRSLLEACSLNPARLSKT